MTWFLILSCIVCGWAMLRVIGSERTQMLHRLEARIKKEAQAPPPAEGEAPPAAGAAVAATAPKAAAPPAKAAPAKPASAKPAAAKPQGKA